MDIIAVREAIPEDLPIIQKLSTELAHSDVPYDADINLQWAYTNDGEKYYREKITNNLCSVATCNGSVIGYTTFGMKELPTWRLVKVAELDNLFVTSQMRSKGAGQKLMDNFFVWARHQKADKAAVCVFSPNDRALSFYKRQGLKEYDINLEMKL